VLAGGLIVVAAAACAVSWGQQVKKLNAVITGDAMTYDWKVSTFDFVGNCKLTMTGLYDGWMTCPKMTAKLGKGGNRVNTVTAAGPVHFEFTAPPDEQKIRHRVIADSQGSATFEDSGNNPKVIMNGGAVADVAALTDKGEVRADAEAAHFAGDSVVVDLKTENVTATKARLEVNSIPEKQ
jgi:lipopolysaccharide export system protein LptA